MGREERGTPREDADAAPRTRFRDISRPRLVSHAQGIITRPRKHHVEAQYEHSVQPMSDRKTGFWCAACGDVLVARYRECCAKCNRNRRPVSTITANKPYHRSRPPQAERPRIHYAPENCPYERAVRIAEGLYRLPRAHWENTYSHPVNQFVNDLSAVLAKWDRQSHR